MSKQTSRIVYAGQLEGVNLKIKAVHNNGLQESVSLINQGTVAQPMSGWVLASLRGEAFYSFPENFMLRPRMSVVIHSGQTEPEKMSNLRAYRVVDLWWTTDQVWNNHWDIAILFDANGLEINRHSYPHERVMGSSANRQKILVGREAGFEITDALLVRAKKITQKQNRAITSQI